ncbi:copper transporter 6-like [Salvia miltiorrhiza]|uniref:copper transporter 6-like n=1 Tax=Salvia miltiorrhiza TaxID=226208 RepID=UPI0025AD12D1|nr:copper transporter 6-like [Salvia miltiorrhiza]
MSNDSGNMSMPMPMPMPSPPSAYNNQSTMYMHEMPMMQMSFFWGKDVVVLFSGWPGSGRLGMYILALAAVFLLAVATEVFSVAPNFKPPAVRPAVGAAVYAAVYAVRMTLAYFVMLSVMSFNVGVFLVAVAGHAAGRFAVKYRALTAVARASAEDP